MRKFKGVTIDAIHSRDLDDVIWVERNESGWNVTVSVSNVADAVKIDSEDDMNAMKTGFTRYSSQAVRKPMLRLELSERSLSLLPSAESKIFVAVIRTPRSIRKNTIQELCQKRKWPMPVYKTVDIGKSADPCFRSAVTVIADGKAFVSEPCEATSKKAAEIAAALHLLQAVGSEVG